MAVISESVFEIVFLSARFEPIRLPLAVLLLAAYMLV